MTATRRTFLLSGLALVAAGPAAAQDSPTDRILAELHRQGFDVISMRRTILGRVRILARRVRLLREIVFDPRNGVVLRDYTSTDDDDFFDGEGDDDDEDDDDD